MSSMSRQRGRHESSTVLVPRSARINEILETELSLRLELGAYGEVLPMTSCVLKLASSS